MLKFQIKNWRKLINEFTERVIASIKSIEPGFVATYSQIATYAGNPRGARQVSRVLHSCSEKHSLPWHRVINASGMISLGGISGEIQMQMLKDEGICFDTKGRIDLTKFGWYNR